MDPGTEPPYLTPHPDGVLVDVWAVTRSRDPGIGGLHGGALRVRVSAPPKRGRANAAVASTLADRLGVRRVELVSGGGASRRKRFLVAGIDVVDAAEKLRPEQT